MVNGRKLLISMLCLLLAGTPAFAGEVSVERPVGWRNDGSGKYADATPPLRWERRVITPLAELRSSVRPPADPRAAGGEGLVRARGAFEASQWLVLGPIYTEKDAKIEQPIPGIDEANLTPQDGQQLNGLTWKTAKIDESGVNFIPIFGRVERDAMAYICTYIYTPRAAECGLQVHGDHGRRFLWLNGKPANGWELARYPLQAGWNRLVAKVQLWQRSDTSSISLRLCVVPGPDTQYETQNIAWTTRMPASGYAMPIIVGDRLFITSEPNEVICVDKKTGKYLWVRSDALWYAIAKQEADNPLVAQLRPKAEELERLEADLPAAAVAPLKDQKSIDAWNNGNDARRKLAEELTNPIKTANRKYAISLGWGGGNCGPTPCSDGKHVYVWHGETGILSCFDLDGTRVYTRFAHSGEGGEHGINASPQIVGDRIIVIGGHQWICFNRNTGDVVWTQKYRHSCYGTPGLARVGSDDVAIAPDGQIVRIADGSVVQKAFGPYDGEIASTVVDADHFYLIARGGFCQATLPSSFADGQTAPITFKLDPNELQPSETYPVSSPLVVDGIFYATHSGWSNRHPLLLAIDTRQKQLLYRQPLGVMPEIHYGPDGAGIAASVCYAGGKIFILDNRGATLVVEPGKTFKLAATNVIEHITRGARAEITQSTPVFDGSRIYIRGEENLYCVGK